MILSVIYGYVLIMKLFKTRCYEPANIIKDKHLIQMFDFWIRYEYKIIIIYYELRKENRTLHIKITK